MIVFLAVQPESMPNRVIVQARAEGDNGLVGDMAQFIGPDDEFMGYSYEDLVALGSGRHKLEDRSASADAA